MHDVLIATTLDRHGGPAPRDPGVGLPAPGLVSLPRHGDDPSASPSGALVFFGDSTSDGGPYFDALGQVTDLVPTLDALGYAGRFSNGPVYADLLPGLLGIESSEAFNLAFGSATVLGEITFGAALAGDISAPIRGDTPRAVLDERIDVAAQIERFLADPDRPADLGRTTAFLQGGGGDLETFVPPADPAALADAAIAFGVSLGEALLARAATLVEAGVGTVVLQTSQPAPAPLGEALGPGFLQLADLVVGMQNTVLAEGVAAFRAGGVDARLVDLNAIVAELVADGASHGFRETEASFLFPGDLGAVPPRPELADVPLDQILYFDVVHYTTAAHGIIAAFEAASLTSETVVAGEADDRIEGTGRADLVLGGAGDDVVALGRGDDTALAGLGDDVVRGGRGDDLLNGGGGSDRIFGGGGRDLLADGAGDDLVAGGRGHDLLIDGAGSDILLGGAGDDVIVFTEAALFGRDEAERDIVIGGRGADTLVLRVTPETAADLDVAEPAPILILASIGLVAIGIETVIVQEGLDLAGAGAAGPLAGDAELWNLL